MHNTTTSTNTGGTPLLVHGTLTAYSRGCRCTPCTARATQYSATRSRLKAYGRWTPHTDATPVLAHLRALQDVPMPRREIALRAGLNPQRIKKIITGGARSIRTADATAILNIPIPTTAPPSNLAINATATRRRLQALIATGYTMPAITRAIGIRDVRYLWGIVHGRQTVVTTATATNVSRAYDELWDQPPASRGVSPARAARAIALAAKHRWAPPMAWDDDTIDDPAALPDWTGRCGTSGGYYDHGQIGTPTCQPCRDAVAVASAERKAKRRANNAA
jgi:hypothetical protein